jgi:hypothetical protein
VKVVAAAYAPTVDEYLRHRAPAACEFRHLRPRFRVAFDGNLHEIGLLLVKQPLGGDAIGAGRRCVNQNVSHYSSIGAAVIAIATVLERVAKKRKPAFFALNAIYVFEIDHVLRVQAIAPECGVI